MGFKDWLAKVTRVSRPERHPGTGILAYFWDGSVPTGHPVKDVSLTGAYVYATDRWYAGTLVDVGFRRVRHPMAPPSEAFTFSVRCRVIRHGPDGMGLAFVLRHPHEGEAVRKLIRLVREVKPAWEPRTVILPHAE